MSIYKEQILPAINNCRASTNFVEHIEGNHINYTQNNSKTQAQIVSAFPLHSISPLLIMC